MLVSVFFWWFGLGLNYCFVRVCFGVGLGFVLALVWGLLGVGFGCLFRVGFGFI